jgi:hypothetical protein
VVLGFLAGISAKALIAAQHSNAEIQNTVNDFIFEPPYKKILHQYLLSE